MPFERLSAVHAEETVTKTVDALKSGKMVVLPTETVYGLAARAFDETAVRQLIQLKGRQEGKPFALAFAGIESIYDFVPEMDELALRLARRCLPGPVSLVLDVPPRESDFRLLPESVQKAVSRKDSDHLTVSFRVPHHPLTTAILSQLDEPVVLTSANRGGSNEKLTVEEIIAELGNGIDVIVDDGSLHGAKPSTVIRVENGHYSVLREGALKKETLDRLTARMILFVCTGNTCRSPMAERICEKLLAQRLHCSLDQLEEHGFVVLSSGVAAGHDAPASPNAVEVLKRRGLDLTDHRSQQLNETHVRFADHIFAMTRGHREAVLSYWPGADTRLTVLRTDNGDISDPIGGSESDYEACARQLESEIAKRLDEILL